MRKNFSKILLMGCQPCTKNYKGSFFLHIADMHLPGINFQFVIYECATLCMCNSMYVQLYVYVQLNVCTLYNFMYVYNSMNELERKTLIPEKYPTCFEFLRDASAAHSHHQKRLHLILNRDF